MIASRGVLEELTFFRGRSSGDELLDKRTKSTGVILCDQARTLDIKARNYEFIEAVPEDILFEAVDIIDGFIEMENDLVQ